MGGQPSEWLRRIQDDTTVPELTIAEVEITAEVMRIYTDAPDDGYAALVCFDAQRAGWDLDIEVYGNREIRAWTGAGREGCAGWEISEP